MSETQTTQIQTQTPNPIDEVKRKVIEDIKRKLQSGELLMMIVEKLGFDETEDIAGLLFNAQLISEQSLHEDSIKSFISYIQKLGYNIDDIKVMYDIFKAAERAYMYIYLTVENGARSSTVGNTDSHVNTAFLTKTEYQQYVSLVETTKKFLEALKSLTKKMVQQKEGSEDEDEDEE